jgi:hypothetical protein
MDGWKPATPSYLVDLRKFPEASLIPIAEIEPVARNLSHGVFNSDAETGRTAIERVLSLFRGYQESAAIPPVEVIKLAPGAAYKYRLTHGAHRFYTSIAAGFSHIPAVKGFSFR